MNIGQKIYQRIPKFLRSKKAIVFFLVLFFVFAFFGTRGGTKAGAVKTTVVGRQNITSQVTASGKIGSQHESSFHFGTSGKVAWVGVFEGDLVNKWQAIASLDKEKYEIALRQAKQDENVATAELELVYDDISKWAGAESFQNKIKRTTAEAKKNKAVDAVLEIKRNLRDSVLVSPVSGTVVKLNVNAGEEVLPTDEIAKVADVGNIEFEVEVDETDVGKIRKGQTVNIILDSFGDEELKTSVESIAEVGTVTSTESTVFEVKVKLEKEEKFKLGMNGEAKIITDSVDDAMVIPVEAVVDDNAVWVKKGKTYQKREIKAGLESDSYIQITSGLTLREEIVTSGFDQINKNSLFAKIIDKIF